MTPAETIGVAVEAAGAVLHCEVICSQAHGPSGKFGILVSCLLQVQQGVVVGDDNYFAPSDIRMELFQAVNKSQEVAIRGSQLYLSCGAVA